MPFLLRFTALFFLLSVNLWANNTPTSWYSLDSEKKVLINVELFLTSTCSHCHKADAFFKEIEKKTPWLRIRSYVIDKDKEALLRFNTLLIEQNIHDFFTPSVFFCNSRWVGFDSAETTGKDLLHALNYCKDQIEQKGQLTKPTVEVLQRWANGYMFNALPQKNPGARQYLVGLSLLDAFSPCALFSIAGFFALLFLQDTRRKQIITGLLFAIGVGFVHYVQQAYTNFFYEMLPWLRFPAALVGLFVLFGAMLYYKKKTQNWLFLLTFLLAVMIQSYQQTCIMNWSFMFQQWLDYQSVNQGIRNLYQLIYQVLYLVPLIVLLFVYILLIRIKKFAKLEPLLEFIGLLLLSALGLHLIFYPRALSYSDWSIIISIALILLGWFLNLRRNKGLR